MTSVRQYIELLAPAKNAECGIEAVNHGADAVYIGAPKFGARASASNSIEEIEQLVKYAHRYYARVYVALNTILEDKELVEAEKIIDQLYNIGTDALIIQDMGITQLNLPPIPLHASTQTDNRTVEKVLFLEKVGFDQIVLARELSFSQIREVANQTSVKLEAFVHGALCVSYSGQCYISQALCKRSANKGNCAQLCRLPYSLIDASGKVIVSEKHLLSLKDLNLSEHLIELIDAGVSSLKIEGRLKDVSYVKNVTAYYREKLDKILEGADIYRKSSSGKCQFMFFPNLAKSFHRGSTDFFTYERNKEITSFDTPKSSGEYIGEIQTIASDYLLVRTDKKLSNGDGFCYVDSKGCFHGFKANRVEENKIFPAEKIILISKGIKLYRNYDHFFEKELSKKSAERKIDIWIHFKETLEGFCIEVIDENGIEVVLHKKYPKEVANNQDKTKDILLTQFSKTGNTVFKTKEIIIETQSLYFVPPAQLTEWRRELLALLENKRKDKYPRLVVKFPKTEHPFPYCAVDYKGNIHNLKAREFYKKHQVNVAEDSFEKEERKNVPLMFCKHCLKYNLGLCTKNGEINKRKYEEPLFLMYHNEKLRLQFDCKHCEMQVYKDY